MKQWLAVSAFSALVALSTLAGVHAQGVTQPFVYQGFLRQGGAPVNNPSQSMRFRIYDALTGGAPLWDSGTLTVNVSNGLFTVQLNPPVSIWTGADRFLEIQVGTTTLSPRVRIGSTPYANTATLLNMFQTGTSNPNRMVITHSPAFTDWGLQYRDSDDSFHFLSGGTTVLRVGLVGSSALQIPAGAAAGRVLTSDAAGNASWQPLPPGASAWAVSGSNIYNTNTGNVGIGTTAPAARLDILGGNWNTESTEGDLRIGNATYRLKIGVATGGAGAGHATIAAQGGINTLSLGTGTTLATQRALTITGAGLVGIGTTAPTGRLHIVYDSSMPNPTLRLHETAADFARLEFTNTNTARKWQIAGLIGSAVANDRLNFWNSQAGDIMSIRGDGTVAVKVLEITGADLAEKFPTTETLEPGTVVEIDPDNPGQLRKARGAYNTRVAGVVAGANGLSKGIVLGNLEGSENHTPIAMSGRVWVHADATHEAIEPGDLLTTSDTPGHAMKASDPTRAHGTVIGKAMTRLEKGKTGMVLVLVNLQ